VIHAVSSLSSIIVEITDVIQAQLPSLSLFEHYAVVITVIQGQLSSLMSFKHH